MTRKLKALGLTFIVVLAMGVLPVSAASAASFHSEAAHTILSGAQPESINDITTVKSGTWTCQKATYSGTMATATTETVTVTPHYGDCTAFGFVSIPIDINGCTYTINATNSAFVVNCPPGQAITTTAYNCHVKIGAQTIAGGTTYDNSGTGTGRDITVTMNLTGLTYTQTSKAFPGCTSGTFADGEINGRWTVKGADTNGNSVGIWKS